MYVISIPNMGLRSKAPKIKSHTGFCLGQPGAPISVTLQTLLGGTFPIRKFYKIEIVASGISE